MFALVSVSGACSRAGKTALAVTLLRALPPRSTVAVKFTTTEDVFKRCPRGSPCVVCNIDVPYRLIDDPHVINELGTDTHRLATAGARKVIWVITRGSAALSAWGHLREVIGNSANVVMEGSTIVELAQPRLLFFVVHPFLASARWKPTAASLVVQADAVIVNVPASERRAPAAAVLDQLSRYRNRADIRCADVTQPLSNWAPDLSDRLKAVTLPFVNTQGSPVDSMGEQTGAS